MLLPCFAADEGKAAPPFTAKLFDGEQFSLAKNAGNVVVLHFWASWCEACRKEMPALDAYYKAHHQDGLRVISINMDESKNETRGREIMKAYSYSGTTGKDASYKGYGRI